MSFATVRRADGYHREMEITLARAAVADDPAQIVSRMFDAAGRETHDPIEAVEVEIEGHLLELQEGDRLTLRVDVQ
jgi:hypothetical protein